jgi:hypothetical protein
VIAFVERCGLRLVHREEIRKPFAGGSFLIFEKIA